MLFQDLQNHKDKDKYIIQQGDNENERKRSNII